MKVLVVHVDKKIVQQVRSVLHESSPVIRFSDSGLDGLLAARIEHYDLIICGTDLPVVTGYEVVRSLRNSSINKQTPVIFVADVIDEKVEHLSTALGVASKLAFEDVDKGLATVIDKQMNTQTSLKQSGLY